MYVKKFDDKQSKATNWASLFTDKNTAVYFDSFGIEYIPQKVLKSKRQFTTHDIFRMQVDDCVMSGFFCIAGKMLLDYTYSFSPNDYKRNGKI